MQGCLAPPARPALPALPALDRASIALASWRQPRDVRACRRDHTPWPGRTAAV